MAGYMHIIAPSQRDQVTGGTLGCLDQADGAGSRPKRHAGKSRPNGREVAAAGDYP